MSAPDVQLPDAFDVTVTPEDIAEGIPVDAEQCPIALALRRAYPGVYFAVDSRDVETSVGIFRHDAERFVDHFDVGEIRYCRPRVVRFHLKRAEATQ